MQVVGDAAYHGLILSLNAKRIGGRRVGVTRDERCEPNAAAKRVQIDTARGGRRYPSLGSQRYSVDCARCTRCDNEIRELVEPRVTTIGGRNGYG